MTASKYNPESDLKTDIGVRFEALRLYFDKGYSILQIKNKLGVSWSSVNRYIRSWERNRYGLTKDNLRWALKNFEQYSDI